MESDRSGMSDVKEFKDKTNYQSAGETKKADFDEGRSTGEVQIKSYPNCAGRM